MLKVCVLQMVGGVLRLASTKGVLIACIVV